MMYRTDDKITINTYAHTCYGIFTNEDGKFSVSTLMIDKYAYVISSDEDHYEKFRLTVYDLSLLKFNSVKLLQYMDYTARNFINPRNMSEGFDTLNTRDFESYTITYYKNEEGIYEPIYYFILSCYNNGLMFFKIVNHTKVKANYESDLGKEKIDLLEITEKYSLPDLGHIFTEKEYKLDRTSLNFFVSQPSPPVVYEFEIESDLNLNIKRIFEVKQPQGTRYIGNDMITVTQDYLAILLFDLKLEQQVIRIYHRDESNFAMGHIEIDLLEFEGRVSTISFVSFVDCNNIFVRNSYLWQIYEIADHELVINTTKAFYRNFEAQINKTSVIEVKAVSPVTNYNVSLTFNLTVIEDADMKSRFVGHNRTLSLINVYGNPLFSQPVSEYFSGPDMDFDLFLDNETASQDLVLPIVSKTYNLSMVRDLETKNICKDGMFSRYIDPGTNIGHSTLY